MKSLSGKSDEHYVEFKEKLIKLIVSNQSKFLEVRKTGSKHGYNLPTSPVVLLEASTGSGKSKWLPSFLSGMFCTHRVLVVTPAAVDVRDMYNHARRNVASCADRLGQGQQGGAFDPQLLIASAGLVHKWVAGEASRGVSGASVFPSFPPFSSMRFI